MPDQDSARCQCKDHEQDIFDRPQLFAPLVLLMIGSFVLLSALADLPFGVQLGSLIPYTCQIVLGTFSAGRGGGQQPYFFKCAIVRSAIKRLIQRHAVFLIVMVLIETIAFDLTPYMPPSWLVAEGRGTSPFAMGLFIICFCLALVEILTNRSLLERAHRERQVLP